MDEPARRVRKRERADEEDCLPLHAAVRKKRRDTVQALLSQPDTDVNDRTPDGCTSLWLACDSPHGDATIARDILGHGADPNIPNNKGLSPLHAACKRGNVELVELLVRHQAQVNSQDSDGLTPLHYSVWNNAPDVVKLLLAHNADVALTKTDGFSALHTACRYNSLHLVQLLIRHQANVNSQAANGFTPLHCAVESDSPDIVGCLLAHDADANIQEAQGLNALLFTLHHGYGCVNLLLPRTQNLNAMTSYGWTALLLAVYSDKLSTVRALLAHGASLTAHTCTESALQLAITCESFAVFELIWRHTDPSTVSATDDFMRHVCDEWELPYHYKHYELVLNTPGVDLHVAGASGLFYNMFLYAPPTDREFRAAKRQYLNVVGWLLDRGAQLQTKDSERILFYFTECPYAVELWRMIFAKTTPNIFETMVREAIEFGNFELALLLATYCLHFGPGDVVEFGYGLNETFLRHWLALFTPTSKHRQEIRALRLVCWSARARNILNDTPQVKSLLEVSRDATRAAMRASCRTSGDFLAALEELEVPAYLKDIIRLRKPVNGHLLEGQCSFTPRR